MCTLWFGSQLFGGIAQTYHLRTRNGDDDVAEQLRLGGVALLLTDGEVRKRLALQCQFGTQQFAQACNLINHLFHKHGDIAQEAEMFQHVLQQRYAPRGCYCMAPVRLRQLISVWRFWRIEYDPLQWQPSAYYPCIFWCQGL